MRRQHLDKTTFLMFPKRVILKRENSSSPFPQRPHFEDPTAPQFSYCITPCETHIKIYNLLTFFTSDTSKPQHHVVLQHVINVATSLITQSHQDQQPMLYLHSTPYTPTITSKSHKHVPNNFAYSQLTSFCPHKPPRCNYNEDISSHYKYQSPPSPNINQQHVLHPHSLCSYNQACILHYDLPIFRQPQAFSRPLL